MAGEIAAVFKSLAEDAARAMKNIAKSISGFTGKTAEKEEANLARTLGAETRSTEGFTRVKPDQKIPEPHSGNGLKSAEDAAASSSEGIRGNISDVSSAAKPFNTRKGCGDPVDIATGEVVLAQTDVELAGVLPLVLSRSHISSYRLGRWFGPSWASTVDQRLEVDEAGVCYAAEDGMLLVYPTPSDGTSVLPEEGPRWPLLRSEDGDYSITDPQRGLTWNFASTGGAAVLPLRAITDRSEHRIELDYSPDGMLTEIRHSGGYRIGVQATGNRITGFRLHAADSDSSVQLVRYGYNDSGQLTEVINSSGMPLRLDYDAQERLTGWQDRNNLTYRYTYDALGRCVRTSGAGGYMNGSFAYYPDNRMMVYTNSLGYPAIFHLNERGQVVREVDPLDQATLSEWDRYGQLLSRTDPLGRTTRFTYDEAGSLLELIRPDGCRVLAEYDELQLPVTVTDPCGQIWRHTYDEWGNLTTVTDPLGATTSYAYDELRHLSSVTDAMGHVRRVQTNAAGLPIAITDPLGATIHYDRDMFGRVNAVTDPVGGVTQFGWTIEGKLDRRTMPDGATERWDYDGEGNLIGYVDALGQVTRTEIGSFDLPTAQISPDGARLEFSYDTELRLTAVTNPQGLIWRYNYDPAGNLLSETDFNDRGLRYVHDAVGQLIERTNGAGQTTTFTRDQLGNVIDQRADDAIATFIYDPVGRIIRATNTDADLILERDALGRVLAETCNGRTLVSSYDALGRRTYRRTPSGAESVWKYGAGEAPIALHTAGNTLHFDYDPAGREVKRRLGAHTVLAQSWDANHRLTSQVLTAETLTIKGLGLDSPASARQARLVQRRSYGYRPDGYVTTIDDHLTGLRRYDLDPAGRVTAVHGSGWAEHYAYDLAGNVTRAAWPTAPQTNSLDADSRGEREYSGTLIRSAGNLRHQHDAQGRVILRQQKRLSTKPYTWRYTWDANDHLVAVITPDKTHWRYSYDPLGRRIAKQRLANDNATRIEEIIFDWDGIVLAERTQAGLKNISHATSWDWEPDTFRPVAQTERTSLHDIPQTWIDQKFYAIMTDLIGAPTELIGTNGELAWHTNTTLWGKTIIRKVKDADCPLRLPGQYYDPETQLHYNYHRYYSPTEGRYLSSDPLGIFSAPNPHAYVSNPTRLIDPLGLVPGICEKDYKAIESKHGTEVADGVNYNFERMADGSPTAANHSIPDIGNDPHKLGDYLASFRTRLTHTDSTTRAEIAYDSYKQVLIVRTNPPKVWTSPNIHAYRYSLTDWLRQLGDGRYVPK